MIEPAGQSVSAISAQATPGFRLGLVGASVAGVETQFRNLLQAIETSGDAQPLAVVVEPFRHDGLESMLPFLPASVRGTIRSTLATAPLFHARVDAVWTQIDLPLLPWLMTAGMRRIPVIYTADSTPRLLRGFGRGYGHWGGRSRLKARLRDRLHSACLRRATIVNPWTEWAARSMRHDYGVAPDRVRVLPPGVDTSFWAPVRRPARPRPRAIFVGGDFVRKGGDLLLSVFREHFRGRLELSLVTREVVVNADEGVHVYTDIKPNDPRLLKLYQDADFLVIPTRADCFSMSGLEAMSTGLPVITCPVGGVAELLTDGREGFFVQPDDGRALVAAMGTFMEDADLRQRMGDAASGLARARYDAAHNASRLVGLLSEAASL